MIRFASSLAIVVVVGCAHAYASVAPCAPRSRALPEGTAIPGIGADVSQRFREIRRNELAFLRNIAAEAGRTDGEVMGDFAKKIAAEYEAYGQSHGGDSSSALRAFARGHYAAARFLTEMDKYRLMVRSNVLDGRFAIGTEFEGWELGPPYENNWKVRFSARQLAGDVFAGLEMLDDKGFRRFDGTALKQWSRQLVVILDSVVDEETQTVLDTSESRRIVNRRVFRASTGECLLQEDF